MIFLIEYEWLILLAMFSFIFLGMQHLRTIKDEKKEFKTAIIISACYGVIFFVVLFNTLVKGI